MRALLEPYLKNLDIKVRDSGLGVRGSKSLVPVCRAASLVTECRERIDPDRPPCRDGARDQRHRAQQADGGCECWKVGRCDAGKRAGDHSRSGEASGESKQDSDADEQHPIADDQHEDPVCVRTERQSNAHFARAP